MGSLKHVYGTYRGACLGSEFVQTEEGIVIFEGSPHKAKACVKESEHGLQHLPMMDSFLFARNPALFLVTYVNSVGISRMVHGVSASLLSIRCSMAICCGPVLSHSPNSLQQRQQRQEFKARCCAHESDRRCVWFVTKLVTTTSSTPNLRPRLLGAGCWNWGGGPHFGPPGSSTCCHHGQWAWVGDSHGKEHRGCIREYVEIWNLWEFGHAFCCFWRLNLKSPSRPTNWVIAYTQLCWIGQTRQPLCRSCLRLW